jgi:hypothetical protein
MNKLWTRSTLAVAGATVAVAAGGGAAIAASQGSSSSPQAFFDSVAKHLGISSEKLADATKAAAVDQVDAALQAGTITEAQADALKARIEASETPLLFGRGGFPGGHHGGMHLLGGHFADVASYLGLTTEELRTKLEAGQSLAEVATSEGKSVDGLKQTILDNAKERLDQAVTDGTLTSDQRNELLDRLEAHVDDIVNGEFHRGFRGPPPASAPAPAFFGLPA